jgi:hypothetical protein
MAVKKITKMVIQWTYTHMWKSTLDSGVLFSKFSITTVELHRDGEEKLSKSKVLNYQIDLLTITQQARN